MRKLTFVLMVCLLLAGASFAQVYVPLTGPPTSIQFKNNGTNYGTPLNGGGSINLAPGCTASGTSPNFTITCSAMVYPGAGIPVSTGSAWDTSISPSGAKCYPFQGSGGTGCDSPGGGITSITGPADILSWSIVGSAATATKQNQNADYILQGPPSGSFQTPTIVQAHVCALTHQASPFVCAWNGAPATGNDQIINVEWDSASSECSGGDSASVSLGTLSDGGINTFTSINGYSLGYSGANYYKKENATGGAASVSVPFTGSTSACALISIVEISGATTVDQQAMAVNSGGCPSVTTTSANEIILCFFNRYAYGTLVTGGLGWTQLLPFTKVGAAVPAGFSEYQLEGATGTYTPSVGTGGDSTGIAFTLAINAATFGGGGAVPTFGPQRFTGLTMAAFPGLAGTTPASTPGSTQLGLQVGTPIFKEGATAAYVGNNAGSTLYTVPAGNTQSLSCSIYADCRTQVSTATVIPALIYTDHSNTAETLTGATATCTTLGTNSVSLQTWPIRAKAGTTVYFKTTIANSPDYDATAVCSLISTQ